MSSSLYKYACLCAIAAFVAVRADDGPYLQVYPPVNTSDDRIKLHFALMLSFGGDYTSIGALPGVQIALDYINSQPSILPGYSLHYTLTDSQVMGQYMVIATTLLAQLACKGLRAVYTHACRVRSLSTVVLKLLFKFGLFHVRKCFQIYALCSNKC